MADFVTNVQADFSVPGSYFPTPSALADVLATTPSLLQFRTPDGRQASFTGTFEYMLTSPYLSPASMLNGITYSTSGGTLQATFTGLSIDENTYQSYLSANNYTGLLAYALRGNDTITGSVFDDALQGFAGSDTLNGGAGNDIAVFSGARASYTLTAGANGQVIVADGRGESGDGTDTLVSIEYLKFADLTWAVDLTPPSVIGFDPANEAAGVAISSNVAITFSEPVAKGTGSMVLMTATGAVVEIYNAASSSNLAIYGNTLTIDPTADLNYSTGYKIEFAAGTIQDAGGNGYAGTTVYGFTTAAFVNHAPTGTVGISGTATTGQTLTVSNSLADVDGLGAIAYQWQAGDGNSWTTFATGDAQVLGTDQVGKQIRVTASYTDGHGTAESASSSATVVVGTTLPGTSSNDAIAGSAGVDTAVYSGSHSLYSFSRAANGLLTVRDTSGADGTDTLTNIERIQFSDTKLAFDMDVSQSGGEAALLLGAVVGKASLTNKALVGQVIKYFDMGNTMHDAADLLVNAGVMDGLAGGSSTSAYVNWIFHAVTDQVATTEVTTTLGDFIDKYGYSKADFLAVVANLPLNQEHVGLVGLQTTGIEFSQ